MRAQFYDNEEVSYIELRTNAKPVNQRPGCLLFHSALPMWDEAYRGSIGVVVYRPDEATVAVLWSLKRSK
jgi:hypothetical protein